MTTTPLRFHTLDVFTDRPFGGNPLAVVPAADGLDARRMQRIAREFNLSETVFVQKATTPDALVRARIFTPHEELPFAGHPTVGTACLLAELGLAPAGSDVSFVLEEGVGPVRVRVTRAPGEAVHAELTAAIAPTFGPPPPDTAAIAHALGLEPADLAYQSERCVHATCGLPFLLVPLRVPELLAALDVNRGALDALLQGGWAHSVYVYARGYEGELKARMFSPTVGEDPATGSAAAALAGRFALESTAADAALEWTLHQGVEMGRPSILRLKADRVGGRVTSVRVGGHAVRISTGELLHAG